MSNEFKKIAVREIEEFKADYRARFLGCDAENLTEEDLLREVMNTVEKAGKLGEHVKCVVSVSMLTGENRDVVELLEIPGGAILKCLGHGRKGSIPPRVTERAANQGR